MSCKCQDDHQATANWPLFDGALLLLEYSKASFRCIVVHNSCNQQASSLWLVYLCEYVCDLPGGKRDFCSVFDFHACDHYIFLLVGISLIPPHGVHFILSQWILHGLHSNSKLVLWTQKRKVVGLNVNIGIHVKQWQIKIKVRCYLWPALNIALLTGVTHWYDIDQGKFYKFCLWTISSHYTVLLHIQK